MLVSMIRSIILYFLLLLSIRLMGKRQLGELEPSEFVIAMLLADLAAVPMQDLGIPLLAGVIPILTVVSIEILLSVLTYHVIWIRRLLCGTPVILIENGIILEKNLKKTRITTDELMEQLRENGFLDLQTIQYAILETNGAISAFSRSAASPVTKSDLKIHTQDPTLPVTLISNGKLLKNNLPEAGITEHMLDAHLRKKNLRINDVFLLTADRSGSIYIARKQDRT